MRRTSLDSDSDSAATGRYLAWLRSPLASESLVETVTAACIEAESRCPSFKVGWVGDACSRTHVPVTRQLEGASVLSRCRRVCEEPWLLEYKFFNLHYPEPEWGDLPNQANTPGDLASFTSFKLLLAT